MESELRAVEDAGVQRVGPPLRAVALLTRAAGGLDQGAPDAHGMRRRRAAAREIAVLACEAAAYVHGAFGDRPEADVARERVHAELRARTAAPAGVPVSVVRALGEVAGLALALPALAENDDWQLAALAFVDEPPLRQLYDGCLALAAVAVREAATS